MAIFRYKAVAFNQYSRLTHLTTISMSFLSVILTGAKQREKKSTQISVISYIFFSEVSTKCQIDYPFSEFDVVAVSSLIVSLLGRSTAGTVLSVGVVFDAIAAPLTHPLPLTPFG